MRFPLVFKRQFGAVSADPLIGSDANPFGNPKKADNYGSFLLKNNVGWPIQRIVVGMGMSTGTPAAVTTNIWAFDEATGMWFIAASKAVTPGLATGGNSFGGQLVWFDMPVPADPPVVGPNPSQTGNVQRGIDVYVQLTAAGLGAGNNAIYTIAVAPDLSNTV